MPRRTAAIITSTEPQTGRTEDPLVQNFLDKLPEAHRVTIAKMNETTGRYVHRGSTGPDALGIVEEYLQGHFGGGLYRVSLHDADGLVIASRTAIEVGDLAEDERPAKDVPPPSQTLVPAGLSQVDLVAIMREEINRNHQLMLEMIRNRESSSGSSVGELVNALAQIKQLAPPQPAPARTEEIFLKGLEFARKASGTGGNDDSLLGILREVFELAKPIVTTALAGGVKPAAATDATPAAPIAGQEENMEVDIEPALLYLKSKFRQGTSTNVLAEIIIDQMQGNDDYTQLLLHIVNQPAETFLALDDDFAVEPFKTAAINLHAELKRRLIPAPAPETT